MAELIVWLRGRELQRIPIIQSETTIGRDEDCSVVLDNAGVSRKHASISYRNGVFRIRDLGSQNGFTLNGDPATDAELQYGDVLGLNKFEIHFSAEGGVSPDLLEPATKALGNGARNVVATMTINTDAARKLQEQWIAAKENQRNRAEEKRRAEPKATDPAQIRTHLMLAGAVFIGALVAALWLKP